MSVDFTALRDALSSLEEKPKPRKCAIAKLIEQLPEDIIEILERLMANPKVSTRAIHDELKKIGMRVGRDTLATHRQQRCTCGGAA